MRERKRQREGGGGTGKQRKHTQRCKVEKASQTKPHFIEGRFMLHFQTNGLLNKKKNPVRTDTFKHLGLQNIKEAGRRNWTVD